MTALFPYQQMLVSPLVGGAAKLAMEIHRYVVAHRGKVSRLLVPGGGDAERTIREQQFDFINYDLDGLVSRSRLRSLLSNLALYRQLRRTPPSLLHLHSPFVFGAARPLFSLTGYRSVLHVHLDYTVDQLSWPLRTAPDLIILSAKSIRPQVEEALKLNKQRVPRISVIQNAVDIERFKPGDRHAAKRRAGISEDVPLAVVVANLAPHKGHETAIRAVAATTGAASRLVLWIVGEERDPAGTYRSRLEALTRELGVADRVKFLGFRADIPEILQAADYLLLPSTSETLSLVILEAQASKTVVLAAPTADIPEVVIDGQSGYLVAADDPSTYAKRLDQLCGQPALADEFAENALRRIRDRHVMSAYCARVLEEYDQLLAGTA